MGLGLMGIRFVRVGDPEWGGLYRKMLLRKRLLLTSALFQGQKVAVATHDGSIGIQGDSVTTYIIDEVDDFIEANRGPDGDDGHRRD